MNLMQARDLIDKMAEFCPDQEIRLTLPFDGDSSIVDHIRSLGYFTHLEGSAHADIELVVKDKIDGDTGPTRSETSPS